MRASVIYLLLTVGCVIELSIGQKPQSKCKLDIAFVVDSSSSIWVNHFKLQRNFIHDMVNRFESVPEDVQIAAVSFSNRLIEEFDFNSYNSRSDILEAVENITYSAGDATRLYLAIEYMRNTTFRPGNGARDDAIHVGVVMTDGVTNPGSYDSYSRAQGMAKTQERAEAAKNDNIFLFAVGIGSKTDENELRGIASDPDDKFFISVEDYEKLNTEHIVSLLSCRVCKAPTYERSTRNVRRGSLLPMLSVERVEEACRAEPVDIVFILDESTSIYNESNFRKELNFVSSVTDMFDIGPDMTHVSVITYSDESQMRFNLNKYKDKQHLEQAIANIDWTTGNTYTNKALDMLLAQSMAEFRPGISHIGIVITDGRSTDEDRTRISAQNVLHTGDIVMFAIGIGQAYKPELDLLASKPSEDYVYQIESLDALSSIQNSFAYSVCLVNPGCDAPESCDNYKADIVVISDASSSIGHANFRKQKDFIANIVERYNIGPNGVQIGMISYSNNSHVDFQLKSFRKEKPLMDAINRVGYMTGLTFTDKALELMNQQAFTPLAGARDDVPKVGIVITDGVSRDQLRTLRMAREAKDRGITIFAIGIGQTVDMNELKGIASDPPEYYTFMVDDFASLMDHEDVLVKKTCSGSLPPTPSVDIVEEACRAEPVDIVFILDESTSIYNESNFRKELNFVSSVTDMFDIGPDMTHVSVITYSDESQMRFNLNKYKDKQPLEQAIANIDWTTGNTYTNKALDMLLAQSMAEFRPGISHIGIVITDGRSTREDRTRISAQKVLATGDIVMFAIGIGQAYKPELDILASKPSEDYVYQIESLDALSSIKDSFAYSVCTGPGRTTTNGR